MADSSKLAAIISWLKNPDAHWISSLVSSVKVPELNFWTGALGLLILYKLLDRLVRIPRIGKYSQRYVVVTGASRGFGYETVRRLDAMGCHVFAGVRTAAAADKIRGVCSTRVEPVIIDIAKPDTVRTALEFVNSKLPRGKGLWGLVNNAGIGTFNYMEWVQISDYEEFLQTNVIGTVTVTMAFLPLLKRARGRIVNVTSISGRVASPAVAPYTMSKYAIEAYSDCLRRCMRRYGVKVHLVEPGTFNTEIITNLNDGIMEMWERTPPLIKEELGQKSLDAVLKSVKTVNALASDRIGDVVDAYVHALMGRYPRARYVVGPDAAYLWLTIQAMPEWMSDYILDKLQ